MGVNTRLLWPGSFHSDFREAGGSLLMEQPHNRELSKDSCRAQPQLEPQKGGAPRACSARWKPADSSCLEKAEVGAVASKYLKQGRPAWGPMNPYRRPHWELLALPGFGSARDPFL